MCLLGQSSLILQQFNFFTVNFDCMSQRYRKDNDPPVWWEDVPLGEELLGSCLCFAACSIIHRRWEQTEHISQCWGGEQWGFGFTLWQEDEGIATWELVFCLTAFIPQILKKEICNITDLTRLSLQLFRKRMLEKRNLRVGLHVSLRVQGRNDCGGGCLFLGKRGEEKKCDLIQIGGGLTAVLWNIICFTVLR